MNAMKVTESRLTLGAVHGNRCIANPHNKLTWIIPLEPLVLAAPQSAPPCIQNRTRAMLSGE